MGKPIDKEQALQLELHIEFQQNMFHVLRAARIVRQMTGSSGARSEEREEAFAGIYVLSQQLMEFRIKCWRRQLSGKEKPRTEYSCCGAVLHARALCVVRSRRDEG